MASMSENSPRIRPYRSDGDARFVERILLEVGWRKPSERKPEKAAREAFQNASDAFVAELSGEPECYVATMSGDYDYRGERLPFSAVTGVVTSRVARKQGLASRTTARALAAGAERGSVVAGLGIFDQGFYDKLGFGTGGYEHFVRVDPAALTVPYCRRTPVRLTTEDLPEMHAGRLARRRRHGSVSIHPEEFTDFQAVESELGFGLGFRDEESGELTHHLYVHTDNGEEGPYRVIWMAYRTIAQFVELLGLLRNLGDQVYLVWLAEPEGVQLQDFIDRPFRRHRERRKGDFEVTNAATAVFQYRMLDVERAMAAAAQRRALPRFVMRVDDPASRYLHDHDGWQGVAGDYEVSETGAVRVDGRLAKPDVVIGVGDLTRAWSGVVPVTTLRDTRGVRVGDDLAAALDGVFAGSQPRTDWLY